MDDALSKAELAARAGVSESDIDRMVSFGILIPPEADGSFAPADVRRARLAKTCERAGLPLEGIGQVIEDGKLSLAFLDLPNYGRWSPLSDKTYGQLAEESGVPVDVVLGVQEAMGFARPEPGDQARADDIEMIASVQLSLASGVLDPGEIVRIARVYSDSMRRIADAETTIYHEKIETPMLRSGMKEPEIMQRASELGGQFLPLQDRTIMALYNRHRERAWTEDIVGHIETALEEAGLYQKLPRPPAMAFVDLTGYTRLTEERGDQAAAELASDLAVLVEGEAQRHGGRPVKWLGDGIMFHFKDPAGAVMASLDIVDRTPQAGLPPAHAGVAAGPVITQDGDYFGRTVNMASRIAGRAGAGEVLVGPEVAEAVREDRLAFQELGPVELKGALRPVILYQAARA